MKCLAMFFAICLTICILATIVEVGVGVIGAFVPSNEREQVSSQDSSKKTNEQKEMICDNLDFYDVERLEIESSVYKVQVKSKKGLDCVRIQKYDIPSSYRIEYDEDSKTITTEDDNWVSSIFNKKHSATKGKIVVYVPKKQQLDEVDIEMGVGAVSIEDIKTDTLTVACGVGSLSCEKVSANYATIEGGVGSVDCDNVTFKGLEVSGGVGDVNIEGDISGKADISAGMGNFTLTIDGNKEDYNYKVETGLGPIYIDGEKTSDVDSYDNSQDNLIDVEGGIGAVHVNFK